MCHDSNFHTSAVNMAVRIDCLTEFNPTLYTAISWEEVNLSCFLIFLYLHVVLKCVCVYIYIRVLPNCSCQAVIKENYHVATQAELAALTVYETAL